MTRINHRTTSVQEAARLMRDRFGAGAAREASNRSDATEHPLRASFWERVTYEIEALDRLSALSTREALSKTQKEST